jgi:hypothetical protein
MWNSNDSAIIFAKSMTSLHFELVDSKPTSMYMRCKALWYEFETKFESYALLHGNFTMDEENQNIIHLGAVLSTWMGFVECSATKWPH